MWAAQVTYSHTAARLVVTLPLGLLLALPLAADAGGLRSSFRTALLPVLGRVAAAAALGLASIAGGLIAPAALGAARVALLGAPHTLGPKP